MTLEDWGLRRPDYGASFTFPAPRHRLSLNDRMHWAERAGITSEWRSSAWLYARHTRIPVQPPSWVQVTFLVPDPTRRRDPHNAMPTVKACIDGMVDAGVWPDDSSRWVAVHDSQFVKGANRVRIDIWPREAP